MESIMKLDNKPEFIKLMENEKTKQEIIDRFHALYYYSSAIKRGTWKNTKWMGHPCQKCPLDLWIYQEIIFETRPQMIIETGTGSGGTALFLAGILELIDDTHGLNTGHVISIDINNNSKRPSTNLITYLRGNSVSDKIINEIVIETDFEKNNLVILDSNHKKNHVLQELRLYSKFVKVGNYIIVEDTNVGGNPVCSDFGEGPKEAIEEFLKENDNFEVDRTKEKFYMTFNSGGFLKRIK